MTVDFSDKHTATRIHKELWNRMATKIRKHELSLFQVRFHASKLKYSILQELGIDQIIRCSCPACEYSSTHAEDGGCSCCPIVWPSKCDRFMCMDFNEDDGLGLHREFECSDSLEEAADIAIKIAELPINTDA